MARVARVRGYAVISLTSLAVICAFGALVIDKRYLFNDHDANEVSLLT